MKMSTFSETVLMNFLEIMRHIIILYDKVNFFLFPCTWISKKAIIFGLQLHESNF